ncbi:MAG: hypothetical protein IIA83_09415 [Thaumarchaeota archaeon]|nr:hypothetical protein [Nitrososphaerota archaeon]
MGFTPPEDRLGILAKIFPTPASTKIMDFFLDHKDLDYPLFDIAENSMLSAQTVARELPRLEVIGLITTSRKIGKSAMYRLNSNLNAIELLSEFTLRMSQLPAVQEYRKPSNIQEAIEVKTKKPK